MSETDRKRIIRGLNKFIFILAGIMLLLVIIHYARKWAFYTFDTQPGSIHVVKLTPKEIKTYCGNDNIKTTINVESKRNKQGQLIYLCPLSGSFPYGIINKAVIIVSKKSGLNLQGTKNDRFN